MRLRKKQLGRDSLVSDRILRALYNWTAGKGYCRQYPSYESIAQDLDVSADQLAWFCPEALGVRFRSLRKRQRVAYAALLMRLDADMPAFAAGRKAGISDKSDFRRQFIEVMRMDPEDWRALSG